MRRIATLITLAAALVAVASSAPSASGARFDTWTDYVGVDPVATLSDLDVDQDALSPNGDRVGERIDLGFDSLVPQRVRVLVLDADANTVRSIIDKDVPKGPVHSSWDGRLDSGRMAPDGDYELVIEAEAGGQSMSVSDTVHVDRIAPIVTPAATRVRVQPGSSVVKLPLRLSEAAMVSVRMSGVAGRSRTVVRRDSGVSTFALPTTSAATRRLVRARRAGTVRVEATATDSAGNSSTRSFSVSLVPAAPTGSTPGGNGGSTGGSTGGDSGSGGGSSTLTWPLAGPLTSGFGPRWGRMHQGIDLGVPTGRRIGAAAPGRVTYAGSMGGYGLTVIIDHGSIDTLYAHQSRLAAHVGEQVSRGETIGYVGSTGHSTGPHLHFETRVNGVAKNPLNYLP